MSKELFSSKVYFYTCSTPARQVFFFALCTGHFYCAKGYEVDCGCYDSFLQTHVVVGKGDVCDGGQRLEVRAGQFRLPAGPYLETERIALELARCAQSYMPLPDPDT